MREVEVPGGRLQEDRDLANLDQFAGSEFLEVFQKFVLEQQEYRVLKEAQEKVGKEIEARLGDKAKLMELYEEMDILREGIIGTAGFTAGLRAAFKLLSVISDPGLLIFPAWGDGLEESCRRVLEEMEQVLDGKTA